MENTFLPRSRFIDNLSNETSLALDVYDRRRKDGMKDYSLATYDFGFISDTKEKLAQLGDFLAVNYGYTVNEIQKKKDHWELTGDATEFPVDELNLFYWVRDLYFKGYDFDCLLDGYGAMCDPADQHFPDLSPDKAGYYFDLAMQAYEKKNFGMSFIHFSTAIKIKPKDPNAWYSRAIVRDKLHTPISARRDYDKAIELAPDFVDAIVNRAVNKDEDGKHEEAIADYTRAIELSPKHEMAYFNRGNSKFSINDHKGACEDWNRAKELGAKYAQQRIDKHCK